MKTARIWVIIIGVLLPYLVRLPGGTEWISQYTDTGIGGFLFFGTFNALAWGGILAASFLYRRPASVLFPACLGFGFLAYEHFSLNLTSSSTASIALVAIPIYALGFIFIGGILGFVFDRKTSKFPIEKN